MQTLLRNAVVPLLALSLTACGGEPEVEENVALDTDTAAATLPSAAPAAAPDGTGPLLDPETATQEELASIPGLETALAEQIVSARPIEDMTEVDSILASSLDEAEREEVYRRLWKPIDLNTASDEEILLIPGIGDRMLHEFKEYRPYQQIAQFRREMGKYVDDEEVARMERYVEVR